MGWTTRGLVRAAQQRSWRRSPYAERKLHVDESRRLSPYVVSPSAIVTVLLRSGDRP